MKTRVLFVCLGNICRSPTAEGVFRHLVEAEQAGARWTIDSAGTAAYHVGEPPDARSQAAAKRRGIDLSGQRARQVTAQDLIDFDLVLAMDRQNLSHLEQLRARHGGTATIGLFLTYAQNAHREDVPDPYYGGASGFDDVLDLCTEAAKGLFTDVTRP